MRFSAIKINVRVHKMQNITIFKLLWINSNLKIVTKNHHGLAVCFIDFFNQIIITFKVCCGYIPIDSALLTVEL